MTTRMTKPNDSRPRWQRWLAPMLLASLGLHGLILLVPTGASQDEAIPPPDPEQDSVAITRIPPAAPASPAESPLNSRPAGNLPPTTGQRPTADPRGIARIQRPSDPNPNSAVASPSPTRPPAASQRNPGQNSPRPQGSGSGGNARDSRTPESATTTRPTGSSPGTAPSASPAPAAPSAPPANSQPLSGNDLREQLQAYAAQLNLPQGRIDRLAANLRQRFRFDAVASADEVFPLNQTQWQDAIRQDTGVADLSPEALPDPVPLVYRQRVCLAQAPGPVKVGIVTNPDGSHHGDPVVLQSSGYGAVDEKALKAIADQPLPTADHPKAYVLTVQPSVDSGHNPCLDPTSAP